VAVERAGSKWENITRMLTEVDEGDSVGDELALAVWESAPMEPPT
jgi:hypothetical protein